MRGIIAVAGLAVLGAGLAGFVALAWAQPQLPTRGQGVVSGPDRLPAATPAAAASGGSSFASNDSTAVAAPPPVPVSTPQPLQPVAAADPVPENPPAPADEPGPLPTPLVQEPSGSSPALGPVSGPSPVPEAAAPPPLPEPPAQPAAPQPAKPAPVEKVRETPPVVRGPLAQQQPGAALEWNGPASLRVGHPTDYTLTVRNVCPAALQEVMVRVRVPAGMTVITTEPRGLSEGNVFAWELGTLLPRQDKSLTLRVVAEARGDFNPQAWVTFTGSSLARVQAREPRLVVKAAGTERALVGDTATITFTVTNAGDGPAEQVHVHTLLSDGLEHTRGKRVDFEVGTLAPGEARNIQVICVARGGGEQRCETFAEGAGGLKAQVQAPIHVLTPRLELQMVGPGLRYVERKATYTLRVNNPGDAPATNVTVSDTLTAGFKFVSASDGGRLDPATRTVSWFLGELGPGQSREVRVEVMAAVVGELRHIGVAQAARGLKVETELMTRVEALSALALDVEDTEDPVEVGAPMAYDVRITNTGSKTETDIHIACLIPDKMEFKSAQGPVRYRQEGNMIVFEPVASLAPKADLQIRLNVRPLAPGDARFTLQVTSSTLQDPVIEMEATRIYADMPSGH